MNSLRDKTGKDDEGHALEIDIWNGKETFFGKLKSVKSNSI